MTISGKYELLRPLSAAGFRSFHARHVLTGQEVMVHFLNQGQRYEPRPPGEVSAMVPTDARAQILDAGTYEGTPYLVTYPVEDFTTLGEWLESVAPFRRSSVTPSRPPAPPPPPPSRASVPTPAAPPSRTGLAAGFQDVSPRGGGTPKTDSGSFTSMFGPAPTPTPPPPPAGLEARPPQQQAPAGMPPPAAPRASTSPGDFTAMFGGAAPGQQQTAPPSPSPVAPPPRAMPQNPSAPTDPGGFTAMFGQPAAGQQPSPQPTSGTGTPGEFSRMFLPEDRRGPLPSPPPELARPATNPRLPSPQAPGEFTMLFDNSREGGGNRAPGGTPNPGWPPANAPAAIPYNQPPASNRPPVPQAPPSAVMPQRQPYGAAPPNAFEGATQVFQAPGLPPQQRMAPSPLPMSPAGPGEFTMIMRGGQPGSPGGGQPSPGGQPPPAAGPSPAGGNGFPAIPGANVQAPGFHAPQLSMPSVTGPSVSSSGITPPSVRGPYLQAPSMSAPRMDMQLPQMPTPAAGASAGAAAPAGAAAGSPFSPILAAILGGVGTIAFLAIVYVLIRR